jgi:hypothetical protein
MDPPARKEQGSSVTAAQGINDALPSANSAVPPVTVSPAAIDDLGPSFKDQANSVALPRQSDDKRAMAAAAMTSNASPSINAESGHVHPRDNENDVGPSYKDQVNYAHAEAVTHSNSSPPSTKRSNVPSSLLSSVPMVMGVLVPDELLTDAERGLHQETLPSEPECDTIHPTQPGINPTQPSHANDSATPDDSKTVEQMKEDMRFWVKLILLAIFCNTLLVAAVIVGTFCGVGACGSSNSNAVTLPPPVMPPSTIPPSDVPSVAPSLSPEFFVGSPGGDGTRSPTSNIGNAPMSIGTYRPTSNVETYPPTSRPTSIPTRSPTLMPSSDDPPISVGALVAIAVVLDILLVAGCVYGYYKWKRRPVETAKSDACIGDADVGGTVDPVSF